MTHEELVEMVAIAIRRNKFDRNGRANVFDAGMISDAERSDARAAISAVAEALSKPTEGAVRAAVRAQSQFRMNLRSTSPLEWSVTDMRGDEPVVVGVYPNKDYAETALLNFGQGAAIDAALSASPLYPKGE